MTGSVKLGDVVIASHSYSYPELIVQNDDSQSTVKEPSDVLQPTQIISDPDQDLLMAFFASSGRHVFNPSESMKAFCGETTDKLATNRCQVHIGPMGCGSLLVKDANFMRYLRKIVPTTLAVDMESHGVALATTCCSDPSDPILLVVLKSVVDFADGEKDDTFHEYASYASAAAAKYILEQVIRNPSMFARFSCDHKGTVARPQVKAMRNRLR